MQASFERRISTPGHSRLARIHKLHLLGLSACLGGRPVSRGTVARVQLRQALPGDECCRQAAQCCSAEEHEDQFTGIMPGVLAGTANEWQMDAPFLTRHQDSSRCGSIPPSRHSSHPSPVPGSCPAGSASHAPDSGCTPPAGRQAPAESVRANESRAAHVPCIGTG